MHKRLERTLISLAVLLTGLYAVLAFWPDTTLPLLVPETSKDTPQVKSEATPDHSYIEAQVITNLMQLGSAELSFRGLKNRFGGMEEMVREGVLNKRFSNGAVIGGYRYLLRFDTDRFAAHADPSPGPGRHYCIDDSLELRYDDNGRASVTSPYLSYSKNEARARRD